MTQLLPLSIVLAITFLLSLNNGHQHPFLSAFLFVITMIIAITIFDIAYNISKSICNYIDPKLLLNNSSGGLYSNICGVIGYVFGTSSILYLCPIFSDWLLSLS
jgi:hypothetical protein